MPVQIMIIKYLQNMKEKKKYNRNTKLKLDEVPADTCRFEAESTFAFNHV